jgi:hypothetical protein
MAKCDVCGNNYDKAFQITPGLHPENSSEMR